jgi:hypothetical protein
MTPTVQTVEIAGETHFIVSCACERPLIGIMAGSPEMVTEAFCHTLKDPHPPSRSYMVTYHDGTVDVVAMAATSPWRTDRGMASASNLSYEQARALMKAAINDAAAARAAMVKHERNHQALIHTLNTLVDERNEALQEASNQRRAVADLSHKLDVMTGAGGPDRLCEIVDAMEKTAASINGISKSYVDLRNNLTQLQSTLMAAPFFKQAADEMESAWYADDDNDD